LSHRNQSESSNANSHLAETYQLNQSPSHAGTEIKFQTFGANNKYKNTFLSTGRRKTITEGPKNNAGDLAAVGEVLFWLQSEIPRQRWRSTAEDA
jgi:hypothetical protein